MIQFSSQGSSEIWKNDEQSLTVTVVDTESRLSELMYKWTGTAGGPIMGNEYAFLADGTTVSASEVLITTTTVEGECYLWVLIYGKAGNCITNFSSVFTIK